MPHHFLRIILLNRNWITNIQKSNEKKKNANEKDRQDNQKKGKRNLKK